MTHFHIQHDERVLVQVRKHWFILLRDTVGIILAGVVPVIVGWLLYTAGAFGANPAAFLYVSALWLIVMLMALATVWTNYFLDTWIVTDRRIVYVEQISLFHRDMVTLRMERVQDATVQVRGILETLLGFGTLQIQTAGALEHYTIIRGIPDPERVRNMILEQVDTLTEGRWYRGQADGVA